MGADTGKGGTWDPRLKVCVGTWDDTSACLCEPVPSVQPAHRSLNGERQPVHVLRGHEPGLLPARGLLAARLGCHAAGDPHSHALHGRPGRFCHDGCDYYDSGYRGCRDTFTAPDASWGVLHDPDRPDQGVGPDAPER